MPPLLNLLEVVFIIYFSSIVVLTIMLYIGSLFYRDRIPKKIEVDSFRRIAILIPAYKEDGVILHIAREMISLDYPKDKFEVFVIADSFDEKTLATLKEYPLQVVEVDFEESTKAKALNHCLKRVDSKEFDLAMISDADNVMEKDFLQKVNQVFAESDYKVIQAHRTAKNMDTGFSILDAMSEEVNNNLFRKGHNGLGLSSSLIGSGIVFKTDFFKQCMSTILTVDEDKALQLNILESKAFIPYFETIMTYDEKVSNRKNFQNQRRRWLSSQFRYLIDYAGKGFAHLFRGNVSYFLMAVIYNFYFPRVLNLMFLGFITVLHLFIPALADYKMIWLALFSGYFLAIFLSIPRYFFTRKLLGKALAALPLGLLSMFKILFKLRSAGKEFIKTEHTAQEIDRSIITKGK